MTHPIQRKPFFDLVRESLFNNRLSQPAVDGFEAILDHWEKSNRIAGGDVRWLSYILATAYHETAHTLVPCTEIGRGVGRPYGIPDRDTGQTYYGRGFVQLTWKTNYDLQANLLNLDLLHHPDLALDPKVAAGILIEGMCLGAFTGRSLARYFGPSTDDPIGARAVVNGGDHAAQIAMYHIKFLDALTPPAAPPLPQTVSA